MGGRTQCQYGVWVDDSFFFSTGKLSRKSQNLLALPNCIVCPEGAADAVILEGLAKTCTRPAMLGKMMRSYKRKYDWDLTGTRDPIYRVRPRVVFGFVETPGKTGGNPTRWLFPEDRSSRV